MLRLGTILQEKEPWTPLLIVTAAFGLALYRHLRTDSAAIPSPPSSVPDLSQVSQGKEPKLYAMNPEEREYREGFMREAIAMVRSIRTSTKSTISLPSSSKTADSS
jgi:hypothetical protein